MQKIFIKKKEEKKQTLWTLWTIQSFFCRHFFYVSVNVMLYAYPPSHLPKMPL